MCDSFPSKRLMTWWRSFGAFPFVMAATTAAAHVSPGLEGHKDPSALPLDWLLASWNWRPDVLAVLVVLGTVYITGWWRLRREGARIARKGGLGLYLAGLILIGLALLSPLDTLGAFLFTLHMAQHELLMMGAAPLLLLANPLPVILWGLPKGMRYRLSRLLTKGAAVRRALRAMTRMVVALPLYLVNLWGWHYPPAFEMALRNDLIHDLQHLTFFIMGLLFWWPIINPAPRVHGHIPYGFRIFYVIAAALPTMFPLMVLVLTERILYPYYTAVPRLWGLTVLQDQSNGWAIMALAEGSAYLITILLLISSMLEHEERMTRLREAIDLKPRKARW